MTRNTDGQVMPGTSTPIGATVVLLFQCPTDAPPAQFVTGMLLNPCFGQCYLADDRLCQRDDLQEADTGGSSCSIHAD